MLSYAMGEKWSGEKWNAEKWSGEKWNDLCFFKLNEIFVYH